ncbi:hypothetical protein Peur_052353 [Populus x canadensis]
MFFKIFGHTLGFLWAISQTHPIRFSVSPFYFPPCLFHSIHDRRSLTYFGSLSPLTGSEPVPLDFFGLHSHTVIGFRRLYPHCRCSSLCFLDSVAVRIRRVIAVFELFFPGL